MLIPDLYIICGSVTPSPVPAAVSGLKLDSNGSSHSLQVSWVSAEGGVDLYLVTLSAPGATPQERSLPPNITQVVFEGLTPGLSYQVCVSTEAGGQSSERRTSGRTGTHSGGQTLLLCSLLQTHSSSTPCFSPSAGVGSVYGARG